MPRSNRQAYALIHEGAKAFAEMEAFGLRIDTAYLEGAMASTAARIKALDERLRDTEVFRQWRKRFGDRCNLDSREQLGTVLFEVMGYECTGYTAKSQESEDEADWRPSTDEDALERLDIGFVKGYLKRAKLSKLRETYLAGLQREVEGEYLHPFFNLHTVLTMRSSSSDPNFQNIPIRNPEIGNVIRSCFIPRPGHRLVEIDYVAAEVRCAACYHKDPTMLKYIAEGYDLHRDMAAQCYRLPKDKVPKLVRQQAKGLFVFAEFYGDFYVSVAKSMWEAIAHHKLATADGVPLDEHLRTVGIAKPGKFDRGPPGGRVPSPQPGSFEEHIMQVEADFWGKRFKVYDQWRRDWHDAYCRNGGFRTLTGFWIEGVFKRNFVINAPVQGTAFHWLLWSVTRINAEAKRQGLRGRIVGQIHDSALGDVATDEFDDFVGLCRRIMTEDIRAAWPWIITPLEVEVEATDVDAPWSTKAPIKL